jgi:hypothetical protein
MEIDNIPTVKSGLTPATQEVIEQVCEPLFPTHNPVKNDVHKASLSTIIPQG